MMFCAGIVFIKTVFMLYSMFQFINQSNAFVQKTFFTHICWLSYYYFLFFMAIHLSNALIKEVKP